MPEFSKTNQPATGKSNKRRQLMTDALMLSLHREADGCVDADGKPTKRLNQIANQLAQKAADGDIQAIKEVFDRTDGKAIQMIAGDTDNPIVHRVERIITHRSD